jgi:thiamine-monophosphate kinase
VHFSFLTTGWEDLGWKALAENISDVAAMGCRPRFALVSLVLPPQQTVGDIETLYVGMRACGSHFACSVIGGDVVRGNLVTIQVTVVGESLPVSEELPRPFLERSAAQVGDAIAVSGPLGGSAGGLRILTGWANPSSDPHAAERLRVAHRRPTPRVDVGLGLVEQGVRCGMDISDGLLADVGHICERSDVDAEIEVAAVPLYPGLEKLIGLEAVSLALTGGEDYELVCTAPPAVIDAASELLQARKVGSLTVIGSIVKKSGAEPTVRAQTPDGQLITDTCGWDHFREQIQSAPGF